MKTLVSILFFFTVLFGFNKDILILESKLYPKMFLLINNYDKKKILNILIYDDKNEKSIFFKSLLQKDNTNIVIGKKLKNKNFDIIILTESINNEELKKLLQLKKPIFTTNPDNIKNAMFGIYIGARVYPYINPLLIKKADIKINPIIFKVARLYDEK